MISAIENFGQPLPAGTYAIGLPSDIFSDIEWDAWLAFTESNQNFSNLNEIRGYPFYVVEALGFNYYRYMTKTPATPDLQQPMLFMYGDFMVINTASLKPGTYNSSYIFDMKDPFHVTFDSVTGTICVGPHTFFLYEELEKNTETSTVESNSNITFFQKIKDAFNWLKSKFFA